MKIPSCADSEGKTIMSHTLESADWNVAPEERETEKSDWLARYEAMYGPRPADARPFPIVWA
jgi:hypothetical protein